MTSHTIYLLIAFLFGGAISFVVWGWSYHQHKKAWQAEYRRLMGGIEKAIVELGAWTTIKTNKDMADPPSIHYDLKQLWLGDE